jgi:LuxR family maltose regulon positive regulatory protein
MNSRRERLDELFDAAALPLTVVCAPAGYGKTTAVSDWLARREQRSTWLAVEASDNDVENLFPRLLTLWGDIAATSGEGLAVVLDDYQLLTRPAAHRAVETMLDMLPAGVRMIVVSRTPPPLGLGRRRADGTVLEVGWDDLAFTTGETEALLDEAFGLRLDAGQLDEVAAVVAGWPAGLSLVGSALTQPPGGEEFGRGLEVARGWIGDYMREEVLPGCDPDLYEFLLRGAFLDRLYPSLCAAVLEDPGAGGLLAAAGDAQLVSPDPRAADGWVRVHPPLRDFLRREAGAREVEAVPTLHLRASHWFEEAGMLEEAIAQASLAGDGRRAAALVHRGGHELLDRRRQGRTWELIESIPADRGEYGPFCEAVEVAARSLERGDPHLVHDRLRELKARHGEAPEIGPLIDRALISPFFGRVTATAVEGRELFERAAAEPLDRRVAIAAKLGVVEWFDGDVDAARVLLESHLDAMADRWRSLALTGLSLVAVDLGEAGLAVERAEAALADPHPGDGGLGLDGAFGYQALANGLIAADRHAEVDAVLARAEAVTDKLPGSVYDGFSLILRAELELSRHDRERAARAAAAARSAVDRHVDVGVLAPRLAEVERILAEEAEDELRGSLPTPAERRVLARLDRGLTFTEAAADLYVSIHTVKSHAQRLYRRLGVNSRQAAVEVARRRGLLD